MDFVKLYRDNQDAVRKALKSMWCSDPHSPLQESYSKKISELIDTELFTSEKFIPLVQCMDRYESIKDSEAKAADNCVGNLWSQLGKKFLPYKHQFECWRHLNNGKSIVVTTGTGSGKTECFMLPLVSDLSGHDFSTGQIQAIFLYPLNALMEDQKERLQELMTAAEQTTGKRLTFAVYNGNLPEDDGASATTAKRRTQLKRQVDAERKKYPNIIATRKELRTTPPNIILTNPTMLEYMLLRNKDQALFTPKSLRWIVIDEAHTFTGAGAAELAMLLRRVLDAFDVKADDIRFATSSATIGNASSKEEKAVAITRFISDITGSTKVEAVDGERKFKAKDGDSDELKRCQEFLNINDYMRLDQLFPGDDSTEEKLSKLDALCNLSNPLKAKVHFFYRVPSNGLRVKLDEIDSDNTLKLYSTTPSIVNGTPYLELMRCEHCGEYFAVGETVEGASDKYKALASSESDIFDFDGGTARASKLIFTYTDRTIGPNDDHGNSNVEVRSDSFNMDSDYQSGWHHMLNVQRCCPCCGKSLTSNSEEEDDSSEKIKNARSFRVSSQYISRVLAPSILDNLSPVNPAYAEGDEPHRGQQYISFVDSRQGAAKATMQQNLEEERMWIYSRIYHALCKNLGKVDTQVLSKRQELAGYGVPQQRIDEMFPLTTKTYMSWNDIFMMLFKDKDSEILANQFVNKRELSEEYDTDNQAVDSRAKKRYIYSAMIEQLGKRPKNAAAPETIGLFVSHYPKLDLITDVPEEVKAFNQKYPSADIKVEHWKALLKMYLDTYVRSNESLYMKNGDGSDNLDIKICCSRFGTSKPPRRPVHEPHIGDDKQGRYLSTAVLLATLIDNSADNINEVIYNNRADLNPVLAAMWKDLTVTTKLIQYSESIFDNIWDYDRDKDAAREKQYRMNVEDIAFKLYDKVALCDARRINDTYDVPRPIDVNFKGYGPYIVNGKAKKILCEEEVWTTYPYPEGLEGNTPVSSSIVLDWAKENRKILWDNNLWGENGCFANRLMDIHLYPEIFIQAEHTAQVDKTIAKQSQDSFKGRKINILACSTTMEMGVDLGSLELVMMSSVPPHPSNYKQRAGRSGRNDNPRSISITLCNSDSVGLRTILDPMTTLINRPMQTPFVDLNSPQVIQRHVNAYLFRLSGIFFNNARGNSNNLDQELIEMFTPFHFGSDHDGLRYDEVQDANGTRIFPCDLLGEKTSTKYYEFRVFLDGCLNDQRNHITEIIRGTFYDNDSLQVKNNCSDDIERCYNELKAKVEELASAYIDARDAALLDSKKKDKVHGNELNTGYGFLLRHKYTELLSKSIIEYFATNRFTPNANMPVNVVEFDVNLGRGSKYDRYKSSNPSYPLQQAISQYSPGNTIVLENRTAVVRGLLYTGMFKHNVTFKDIYSDGVTTIIGEERKGMLQAAPKTWPVNNKEALTLIEPYAFIPDINEDYSRVMDDAPYTQVSAQLIGAGEWADFSKDSSLVSVRNNRDCGDASILYYNEGIGFGYCFCSNCGKTVMESAPGRGLRKLPTEMNNREKPGNPDPIPYHYMINRRNESNNRIRRIECFSNKDKIIRNVIIGGQIQTDYSEIRIRRNENSAWLFDRSDINNSLLITLGIVFTQTFVEKLGKDRQDVDFAITPDCHLCIFDTNPGGSGYSNQLVNKATMQSVIHASKMVLDRVSSKDELIDRYTKRYYDLIDIDAARVWLNAEIASEGKIPDNVANAFNGEVKTAVFEDIIDAFKTSNSDIDLFVNSSWNQWNYYESDTQTQGWRYRINDIRSRGISRRKNVLISYDGKTLIRPIVTILRGISDWANVSGYTSDFPAEIYPLARVNGVLYFTDQEETASLNADWARGNVYCTEEENCPDLHSISISLEQLPTTIKFKLDKDNDALRLKSNELAQLVCDKSAYLVDEFMTHCASCDDVLKITSQDEHLKSPMGIITSLQFAEFFIRKIHKDFTFNFLVEKYYDKDTYDITKNMGSSDKRNEYLQKHAEKWKEDCEAAYDINGNVTISCVRKKALPHWREFKLSYGGKELVFYPNGGLINEWHYDRDNDTDSISMETLTHETEIPLYRLAEIMYDVEIKDAD